MRSLQTPSSNDYGYRRQIKVTPSNLKGFWKLFNSLKFMLKRKKLDSDSKRAKSGDKIG
jgi:hypothetical protein